MFFIIEIIFSAVFPSPNHFVLIFLFELIHSNDKAKFLLFNMNEQLFVMLSGLSVKSLGTITLVFKRAGSSWLVPESDIINLQL